MRLKFFENTTQSKFILALLFNTFLPIMSSISYGDTIIAGVTYATRNQIVQCTKTGIYGLTGQVLKVRDYKFGYYYPKFTERFIPKNAYYDYDTHKWLGKYLRAYKDYYGIDLMKYYNVFGEDYASDISIHKGDDADPIDSIREYAESSTKVLKMPMKFNTTYTIAIDCQAAISIAPVFLMKDYLLVKSNKATKEEIDVTNTFITDYAELGINVITRYPQSSFNKPITYRIDCLDFDYVQYERDLYLLIQVPYSNDSSVTVLEGDYTECYDKEVVINAEELDGEIETRELQDTLVSDLSLLQFSTGVSYPYADRLIEYLLGNVVTDLDDIGENVAYVQGKLPTLNVKRYIEGAWNDYTRYKLYRAAMDNIKIRHIDMNGFLDKDSETLMRLNNE